VLDLDYVTKRLEEIPSNHPSVGAKYTWNRKITTFNKTCRIFKTVQDRCIDSVNWNFRSHVCHQTMMHLITLSDLNHFGLQCFDAVGWAA